jgi:flagellar hook-basal body complex protein FliE
MPIDALTSVAGPLAGALQPRGAANAIPDAGVQALQDFGKMPDEGPIAPEGPTFGKMLEHALGEVNKAQLHAGDLSSRFAAGEPVDVHQVMIAAQEASVALNLAIQVRNKLVDGYQELMRVNV